MLSLRLPGRLELLSLEFQGRFALGVKKFLRFFLSLEFGFHGCLLCLEGRLSFRETFDAVL